MALSFQRVCFCAEYWLESLQFAGSYLVDKKKFNVYIVFFIGVTSVKVSYYCLYNTIALILGFRHIIAVRT